MTGAEFSEVDFDLLADYVGGALDGTPDEAVVAALIVGHPGWRRAHAELVEATGVMAAELRAWGDEPEPMPADVVARLDAAFAVVAGQVPSSEGVASDGSEDAVGLDGGSAVGGAASGPALAAGVELGGAASGPEHAAGADVAGAHSGSDRVLTHSDGVASGRHLVAVPNDDARPTTARKRARRLRWAAPVGIAAGLVAFLGFGIQQFGARDSDDSPSSAAGLADQSATEQNTTLALPAGPAQAFASGTDYTRQTLAQAATRAVAGAAKDGQSEAPGVQLRPALPQTEDKAAPSPGVRAGHGDPLDRLKVQEALLACLDAISAANDAGPVTAQSVDYARYEGSPAVIVQFTAGNGTWVWAAGADCGARGSGADKLGSSKVG
ncbi:hypothetical protein AB0J80_23080 [Actinoplanes sp. NPDC049548]|uniref:hypothetical protein n=1 Tax=Actinoplanes sp. NPDC049548 TaxID=3155152 RepID=UPI003432CF7A